MASERKNTFGIYKKLKERYATKNAVSSVELQTQLHQMRYEPSKSMIEYVGTLESILKDWK